MIMTLYLPKVNAYNLTLSTKRSLQYIKILVESPIILQLEKTVLMLKDTNPTSA